jgi:flagellar protein FlbT
VTKSFTICLKGGERLYVNGAVLRFDRKVAVEFLNDVTFLLEHHVMKPEDTTTPLRQLYFVVQSMILDPANAASARMMFDTSHSLLLTTFHNEGVLAGLRSVRDFVKREKLFEALKTLRGLFPAEDAILARGANAGANAANLVKTSAEMQTWTS